MAYPNPAAGQPSPGMPPLWRQVRWWILGLLFFATVINFVDRQVLSIVAPILRETFRLSNTDYGTIVAGFQFGMMVGEFPMGWLMDRRGARFGFSFAIVWWSLANALHALGRAMSHFTLLRFWMGTGECGNFSGGVKVVSQWFPVRERAFAIGVFNGGTMIGSILAPPLIVAITLHFGWRMAFLLPSALGLLWVIAWRAVYHPPAEHPGLSPAEYACITSDAQASPAAAPTNRQLLAHRETWALMLCRLLAGPVVQFYVYWMPEYLYRSRGFSLKAIGMFAWVPFLFGDVGSIGGGWLSGFFIRRGFSVDTARKFTMGLGAACCLLSIAVVRAERAPLAVAWICLVLFGHTFLSANMFAVISDVFPSSAAGRVTALTGVAGGFSGFLFPLLTGLLVDRVSYTPVFFLVALMPAAGCLLLFLILRRVQPVKIE
jgi:ACS family hexuronate transporter-like MFS transporter